MFMLINNDDIDDMGNITYINDNDDKIHIIQQLPPWWYITITTYLSIKIKSPV